MIVGATNSHKGRTELRGSEDSRTGSGSGGGLRCRWLAKHAGESALITSAPMIREQILLTGAREDDRPLIPLDRHMPVNRRGTVARCRGVRRLREADLQLAVGLARPGASSPCNRRTAIALHLLGLSGTIGPCGLLRIVVEKELLLIRDRLRKRSRGDCSRTARGRAAAGRAAARRAAPSICRLAAPAASSKRERDERC